MIFQGPQTQKVANLYSENRGNDRKIYAELRDNFDQLYQDALVQDKKHRGEVFNENSFAAGITTNFLIAAAVTKLGPKVAALKAFCRDNSVDPTKPLAKGVLQFNTSVQDGSDVEKNATDFASNADSTLAGLTIPVDQYTVKMHLSNAQLNSGIRFENLIEAKLNSFLTSIAGVVMAPITIANFSTHAPLTTSYAAFNFSDLATLQGQLKKSGIKNLLLDGEYMARIANSPGFFQPTGTVGSFDQAWRAFGWDMIALHTEWGGADPKVRGFACNPQAIGIISGLPMNPAENNVIQTGTAILPGADVAIATYLWMDPNARTMRATYDIMLGSILLDPDSGIIVQSP